MPTFVTLEDLNALFPPTSAKYIALLIERAIRRDLAQARAQIRSAMLQSSIKVKAGAGQRFAMELGKALAHRGGTAQGAPSLKRKAPDTGGRSFHFEFSCVNKQPASGRPANAPAGAKTKAAAHMRYVERKSAVETAPVREDMKPANVDVSRSLDSEDEWDRELGASSAAAGQRYVENPAKIEEEVRVFSFGNIGEKLEGRVAFWESLEEAEAHPNARVQSRLILELPHEASPQARYDIMRAFCQRFEADGLPYWAAVHAPGPKNDARNYHAHVVFSDRPARRMLDEAGQERWDFEITTVRIKASRNRVTSRPYRQDKRREYAKRGFIPDMRASFADIVNEVMERDRVRDAQHEPVRYDPRSYEAMGLDVAPVRPLKRSVAEQMKGTATTVVDTAHAQRQIERDVRAARETHAWEEKAVTETEMTINRLATSPDKYRVINMRLPPRLRLRDPVAGMGTLVRQAAAPVLAQMRAVCEHTMEVKVARAAIDLIVAATEPARFAQGRAKIRHPNAENASPDPDAVALLHTEALALRTEIEVSLTAERNAIEGAAERAFDDWKRTLQAPREAVLGASTRGRAKPAREAVDAGGERSVAVRRPTQTNDGLPIEDSGVGAGQVKSRPQKKDKAPQSAPAPTLAVSLSASQAPEQDADAQRRRKQKAARRKAVLARKGWQR